MITPSLGDRSLFPTLAPRAYLNHCAISPLSTPVVNKIVEITTDYAARGTGAFWRWREAMAALKVQLAALIGAAPGDLALTPNTTWGVTAIATCLPWRRGDRVVVFSGEFPTNVTPWQRAAELHGLEVVMLDVDDFALDPALGLDRLTAELERGVRLVATSSTQFNTGLTMPVGAMAAACHAHGAELFVDGIQSVGLIPLDVDALKIDYMTCGSHKWLMGPEGTGFLYVRPGRAEHLRPHLAGWLSHEEPTRFLFEGAGHLRYDRPIRKTADFLEGGAPNVAGLAALSASVALLAQLGQPALFDHANAYLDALEAPLIDRGFTSLRSPRPQARSGILALKPPPGVEIVALWRALTDAGVSCTMPDGLLRFAPHWPNHLDEIPFVLSQIDTLTPRAVF